MNNTEVVGEKEVIAGLYRAATGELDWPTALQLISEVTSSWIIQLMEVKLDEGRLGFNYASSSAPVEPFVEYACRFHRIDPHLAGLMPLECGDWYHSADHFDDAAVASHPFYQDFLIPYGDRYICGTKLFQNASSAVVLGLHRALGTSPLDGAGRALVERLGFHMSVALSIWQKQRNTLATAAIGEQMLSRMGSPIFLVDSSGYIGVANDEAQQLLDKEAHGGLLQQVAGRLTCANPQANSDLQAALYELGLDRGAAAVGDVQRDRAFVRVPGVRGDSTSTLVLCLLALRPEATMGAFGRHPLAMILVHDPAYRRQLDPFMVAAAYGLSPAEAKVAMALASGLIPKRIALNHSVSIETIRTQMKALYRKLGVSSAIELAAMLNTAPFSFLG